MGKRIHARTSRWLAVQAGDGVLGFLKVVDPLSDAIRVRQKGFFVPGDDRTFALAQYHRGDGAVEFVVESRDADVEYWREVSGFIEAATMGYR